MPVDYECHGCLLAFSLGTYHYHVHDSGYFGRTLLVCVECGLQHSLEVPLPNSSVPCCLESMPDLLIDSVWTTRRGTRKVRIPFADWSRRTIVEDPLGNHSCQKCGASPLMREWPRGGRPCPRCSEPILDEPICTWFT